MDTPCYNFFIKIEKGNLGHLVNIININSNLDIYIKIKFYSNIYSVSKLYCSIG